MSKEQIHNWRRAFLDSKKAKYNVNSPAPYIELDDDKLPFKKATFLKKYANDFNLDYDPISLISWSNNDDIDTALVAEALNQKYPDSAYIVHREPALVHDLCFTSTKLSKCVDNTPEWSKNFKLSETELDDLTDDDSNDDFTNNPHLNDLNF